jgi:DNA-directed RNA polymerase subunit M/transcription elongation factor TFIIS
MSIRVTCPGCGKALLARAEYEGKKVKCPSCGTVMPVPRQVLQAEAIQPAAPPMETYGVTQEPATVEPVIRDRYPCPACGEMIKGSALKCRFCGEIFDDELRRAEKKKYASKEDTDLNAGEWVLCILCSFVGCIVGIVYAIQGKPKGWKMIGISFMVQFVLGIIRVVITLAAMQHR